jgi:hypothetical protein
MTPKVQITIINRIAQGSDFRKFDQVGSNFFGNFPGRVGSNVDPGTFTSGRKFFFRARSGRFSYIELNIKKKHYRRKIQFLRTAYKAQYSKKDPLNGRGPIEHNCMLSAFN